MPAQQLHQVMTILATGLLVSAMAGNVGNLLNMTGRHWANSRIMVGAAFFNLVLLYALTATVGLLGAAFASALTHGITNVTQVLFARRKLGFSTDIIFALQRH